MLKGDTISIFQVFLLCKHPWKKSIPRYTEIKDIRIGLPPNNICTSVFIILISGKFLHKYTSLLIIVVNLIVSGWDLIQFDSFSIYCRLVSTRLQAAGSSLPVYFKHALASCSKPIEQMKVSLRKPCSALRRFLNRPFHMA